MITKFRKRDVVGLGRLELEKGEPYVAARTIVDKKHMPNPVVVIYRLHGTTEMDRVVRVVGPMKRDLAVRAVAAFNRIVDTNDGRW